MPQPAPFPVKERRSSPVVYLLPHKHVFVDLGRRLVGGEGGQGQVGWWMNRF